MLVAAMATADRGAEPANSHVRTVRWVELQWPVTSCLLTFCTQVAFINAIRAKSYHNEIAPHDFIFQHNAADPYERVLGTQVLLDILLLANCDHFLHAESSVASLASYFNPHMKSYFMDEKILKVPLITLLKTPLEMKLW